jgi:CheY-like chemotaxis protein
LEEDILPNNPDLMLSHVTSVAIVDDDEIFRMLLKKILEKKMTPDSILQFQDGFAALLYFTNHTSSADGLPPVIFLDLNMPGMNGWQLLDQLANLKFKHPYRPSVFIVSGRAGFEPDWPETYPWVKGFLTKPITSAQILRIIRSEFEGHEEGIQ